MINHLGSTDYMYSPLGEGYGSLASSKVQFSFGDEG